MKHAEGIMYLQFRSVRLFVLSFVLFRASGFRYVIPQRFQLFKDASFKSDKLAHTTYALGASQVDVTSTTEHASSKFVERIQTHLEDMYSKSSAIKCPFWRRRTADMIDSMAMIFTFVAARHKSLDISICSLPGCKAVGRHVELNADGTVCKHRHLDLNTVCNIIRTDWCPALTHHYQKGDGNPYHRGYYITGKLNSTIYRDDCLFDGPDPDMPVRGLRKYLSAASHLFDHKLSYAVLRSIRIDSTDRGVFYNGTIVATWELGGVLMLPWRPKVKPWTGTTIYHLDQDRLVGMHEEKWDISVYQAFVSTMWPGLGDWIWGLK